MKRSFFHTTFGDIAIELKYLREEQLEEALKKQRAHHLAGERLPIGELLVRLGYLTEEQKEEILEVQKKIEKKTKKFGLYRLIEKLGEGSTGSVYKAYDTRLKRVVAIKILSPRLALRKEYYQRFMREARAAIRLRHPHIVQGYDVGTVDGLHYVAMEFIEGRTLKSIIEEKGAPPPLVVVHILRQIAEALDYASRCGIAHRDVKPENIMLTVDGEAKLADLGLVKDELALSVTQAGISIGTPLFMSPEQIEGTVTLDVRADIYSLGATGFYLLAGVPPFTGSTLFDVLRKHLTEDMPRISEHSKNLPAGLDDIIYLMTRRRREERYQNAWRVYEDLTLVEEGKLPALDRGEPLKSVQEQPYAVLIFLSGDSTGRSVPIASPSFVVGRHSSCDLQVLHPQFSRQHFVIRKEGERFFIEDLNSTNGTYLNGDRVERAELKDGDEITVWDLNFKFSTQL